MTKLYDIPFWKSSIVRLSNSYIVTVIQQRIYYLCNNLMQLKFSTHLLVSIHLRLLLVCYGELQDLFSEVSYTDIDYRVVTDGARHILNGRSPFERHTYRYSPLMAYLQIPNIIFHPAIGKLIYTIFDIMVAILIHNVVHEEFCSLYCQVSKNAPLKITNNENNIIRQQADKFALYAACFWLYNPLTAVISTRGNGDSFSSFFVILTLHILVRSEKIIMVFKRYLFILMAGLIHGFVIHLRLYPIFFSLAYYLVLSDKRMTNSLYDSIRQLFQPNIEQILLVIGTIISFIFISIGFYQLYGWQFIYEAYLYHFMRKDIRHNFSLYFLMQYLNGHDSDVNLIRKFLIMAPQIILVVYLSLVLGHSRFTLPFCIFAITFVIVTFNTVITSQYFLWYLALFPLCLHNFRTIKINQAIIYFSLWIIAQGMWLLPAYLLEFYTWNTFYWIGLQSIIFFIVNNILLTLLMKHYCLLLLLK